MKCHFDVAYGKFKARLYVVFLPKICSSYHILCTAGSCEAKEHTPA